ncbi:MAG: hypothetical protein JWP34_5340 [Massilia sp.]|nr:hypothetical protein [Massilia sp.]
MGLTVGTAACSSAESHPPTSPTHLPTSGSAAAPRPADTSQQDDDNGYRLRAGDAIPLKISQTTRDQLSAAVGPSGPSNPARNIASAAGTIYYGKVFGRTPETDAFYVLASFDLAYFWQKNGTKGAWKYRGGFDWRVCIPPVPRRLYLAWGDGDMIRHRKYC